MGADVQKWIVKRDGREVVVDDHDVTREEFRAIALSFVERDQAAAASTAPAAAAEEWEPQPVFREGDVVRLKSGGFLMTVVNGSIGCGGVIDVTFASEMGGELTLHEEKLPPACLVLVDYEQAQRMIRAASAIASNVPF